MRSRSPLALSAFLAMPLFFGSLMAASLALEKPRVVAWSRPAGHIARIFHDPTAANELRIWIFAAIPPLLLVLAGWGASYLPFGLYVTCGAAIIDAVAITWRLSRWQLHHTLRFPYGEDLIPDRLTASSYARGEWEHDAAQTARSFAHYTIGLALAAAAISLFLTYRRRRAPILGVPGTLQQTGGAPTATEL